MAKLVAQYTYTDAELLALYRECWAKCSQGITFDLEGVRYSRADLPQIEATIARLERRVNSASHGPAFNLARLRGRRLTGSGGAA